METRLWLVAFLACFSVSAAADTDLTGKVRPNDFPVRVIGVKFANGTLTDDSYYCWGAWCAKLTGNTITVWNFQRLPGCRKGVPGKPIGSGPPCDPVIQVEVRPVTCKNEVEGTLPCDFRFRVNYQTRELVEDNCTLNADLYYVKTLPGAEKVRMRRKYWLIAEIQCALLLQ